MAKTLSYINTTKKKASTQGSTSSSNRVGYSSSYQANSMELESINKALKELKERVDALSPKLDAITGESDLNDYVKISHIFIPADITVANRPDAVPEADAYLDVEAVDGQIYQTYSSADGDFKAWRIRYNDSWKAWSRVDNFGCSTITSLADKMGNEASESEEIAALWGQTKEGKMVRILSEPAASIIGNLLYGADTASELATVVAGINGLGYKGAKSFSDANNCTQLGFYYMSETADNVPTSTPSYSTMIVLPTNWAVLQFLIFNASSQTGIVYSRAKTNTNVWSNWVEFI